MHLLISLIPAIAIVFIIVSAFFLQQRRKANRGLKPPEEFRLLRLPGESLRDKVEDELVERAMNWALWGGLGVFVAIYLPLLLPILKLPVEPLCLLLSAAAAGLAVGVWVVKKLMAILDEIGNCRLGYKGERKVAEELQGVTVSGCRVFHDLPIHGPDWKANIDHVVVGLHGVTVVETKTRSKPAKGEPGQTRVRYDGKTLSWPRYSNDTGPLDQVRRNAEWIRKFLLDACGSSFPVDEVVAIPGWAVDELERTTRRVVSGKGVADAVLCAAGKPKPERLKQIEIDQICAALEKLGRNVS